MSIKRSNTKLFVKKGYLNNFLSVPLENTCYMKTKTSTSWSEARSQCLEWGGDLAWPLLSNNTTPKSWLQERDHQDMRYQLHSLLLVIFLRLNLSCKSLLKDDEEVWLAGKEEFHARPVLSFDDSSYQPGTYMACFSDLWRCTDNGGPRTDMGCVSGQCQAVRRGLCAIPPRR